MAINSNIPVRATVITRRVDPGFFTKRVGQTISNPTSVQWIDQDGANIGSPSRFLLLTGAMVYTVVQAGAGGAKTLVLPAVLTLPKSTDQTPAASRTLSTNRSGLTDYDASRPLIDWMKSARMYSEYKGFLATALTGVTTSVVVQSAIPSDVPQTGVLYLGQSQPIAYTSWTGSTFTIQSWDFSAATRSVGSAVDGSFTAEALRAQGVLDSNFWPTRTPNFASNIVLLWADVKPDWSGEYFNITWTGAGSITIGGEFQSVSSGANTLRVRARTVIVEPGSNHWLYVTGACSNITIIPDRFAEAYSGGQRIRPELVQFYNSVRLCRMMDWGYTNNSKVQNWSERALESHAIYVASAGVPYEVMLNFTIAAGMSAMWLCVPHEATNAFCTSLGQWLQANIPNGLTVYLEYSNEASWNFLFSQASYMWDQAQTAWGFNGLLATALTGTTTSVVVQGSIPAYTPQTGVLSLGQSRGINYTSWSGSTFTTESWNYASAPRAIGSTVKTTLSGHDWYGRRAAEVMHLVKQQFTGSLIRVGGVQTYNPGVTDNILTAPQWQASNNYYSNSLSLQMSAPHNYFDALAVAGYVNCGLDKPAVVADMRTAFAISNDAGCQFLFRQFMDDADGGLQVTDKFLREQKVFADARGLKLIGYEGGNHAVYTAPGGDAPPNDANSVQNLGYFRTFYESDYYAEVFYHLWQMWKRVGGGPYMQFSDIGTFSKFGFWTLKEDFSAGMLPVHQVANALSRTETKWW